MSLTMSNTASGCSNLCVFSDILFSSSDFVVNHSATIFAVSLGLRVNTPAPLSTTYGTLPFSWSFYPTNILESTWNSRNNRRKPNLTTHLSWDIVVENYGKPSDQCFRYRTWSSPLINISKPTMEYAASRDGRWWLYLACTPSTPPPPPWERQSRYK